MNVFKTSKIMLKLLIRKRAYFLIKQMSRLALRYIGPPFGYCVMTVYAIYSDFRVQHFFAFSGISTPWRVASFTIFQSNLIFFLLLFVIFWSRSCEWLQEARRVPCFMCIVVK